MAFKKIWTELNLNPSQVYIKLKNHKVKGIRNGEYTDLLRILFGMLSDIILVWAIYGNQNGSKSVTKFSGENMQLSFNSLSFLKDLFSEGKVLHIFVSSENSCPLGHPEVLAVSLSHQYQWLWSLHPWITGGYASSSVVQQI